jgi:hypothetical protein
MTDSQVLIPDITLPTIQGSPVTTARRPPLQALQREDLSKIPLSRSARRRKQRASSLPLESRPDWKISITSQTSPGSFGSTGSGAVLASSLYGEQAGLD